MTKREFLQTVAQAGISEEVEAYALESIAKMDAELAARKAKKTPAQLKNEAAMQKLYDAMEDTGIKMTAAEAAEFLGVSTQKASAYFRMLGAQGMVTSTDVKGPAGRYIKSYVVAGEGGEGEIETEGNEVEVEVEIEA